MEITEETVDHIAHLARLEFKGDAKIAIRQDLSRIIQFMDKLSEIDTENVEPLIFMSDEVNVLREDIAQETLGNPERVAVTLIAPTTVPETLNVGVASFVISSLFETPKSDAAARSGVACVTKVLLLITTLPSAVLASELTPPPD